MNHDHDHEPEWSWKSATWGIILAIIIVWMFTAPWAQAATWHVAPNGHATAAGTAEDPVSTVARAHALASPNDTIQVAAGRYPRHTARITKNGIIIRCARGARFDGEHKETAGITLAGQGNQLIGCHFGRYLYQGIRLRGTGALVDGNTIQQQGSYWGCPPGIVCSGFAGISVKESTDNVVVNNRMLWMKNHDEEAGKIHGIYISNRARRNVFRNNLVAHSTGTGFKLRNASGDNFFIDNTCIDMDVCFTSAEPPGRGGQGEQPSQDNVLIGNYAYRVKTFIECRDPKRNKGQESAANCTKYGIVKPGAWQLVQSRPSKPPSKLAQCKACLKGSQAERKTCVLRIKRNKCTRRVDRWGKNDCRRCFG